MTTGQRIQQARKKAGLSQKQLGEKLGLSASMIGQWENDLRNPKIETLFNIADALGVSISDLYDFSIQAQQNRTLEEINKIKSQLETASGEDRAELEYALEILEESYEDTAFAEQLTNMAARAPKREKTKREKVVDAFDELNDDGQQKAVERIQELTEIPRYRRQEPANDALADYHPTAQDAPEGAEEGE